MNGEVYRSMLNDILPPLEETVFVDKDEYCFQQDSAPACEGKKMQKWLQEHVPDLIEDDNWVLDYKLWSVLEERFCDNRT